MTDPASALHEALAALERFRARLGDAAVDAAAWRPGGRRPGGGGPLQPRAQGPSPPESCGAAVGSGG